jgi:hypothetical protein
MTDLEKLLVYCQDLKNGYDDPRQHCEDYDDDRDTYEAKSRVLDYVIDEIKSLMGK